MAQHLRHSNVSLRCTRSLWGCDLSSRWNHKHFSYPLRSCRCGTHVRLLSPPIELLKRKKSGWLDRKSISPAPHPPPFSQIKLPTSPSVFSTEASSEIQTGRIFSANGKKRQKLQRLLSSWKFFPWKAFPAKFFAKDFFAFLGLVCGVFFSPSVFLRPFITWNNECS